MKKVFGVLAFISFFLMFGFVGAVEQDMVPLGIGTFRMFAALGAWALFTWLAGGFEPYPYDEENRPRSATSKGGKRKSSL
jgi:hypothetical protein